MIYTKNVSQQKFADKTIYFNLGNPLIRYKTEATLRQLNQQFPMTSDGKSQCLIIYQKKIRSSCCSQGCRYTHTEKFTALILAVDADRESYATLIECPELEHNIDIQLLQQVRQNSIPILVHFVYFYAMQIIPRRTRKLSHPFKFSNAQGNYPKSLTSIHYFCYHFEVYMYFQVTYIAFLLIFLFKIEEKTPQIY